MEIRVSPELQARVNSVAIQNGSAAEEYVQKLVAYYIYYDEWFVAEVEKGIAAADHGELI